MESSSTSVKADDSLLFAMDDVEVKKEKKEKKEKKSKKHRDSKVPTDIPTVIIYNSDRIGDDTA
jgi:hypothetical protein